MTRRTRRALPAVVVGACLLVAVAWVVPSRYRNPLWETCVWSLVVMVSLAGWGSLVKLAVARGERVDLGLRIVWGACAICFLGGALMVPSLFKRGLMFLMMEAGVFLALGALFLERGALRSRFEFARRFVKREPRIAFVLAIAFGFLALHFIGGVADNHTNPYDDEIAYFTFVRKMFHTGSFPEPFSFRRLSALGGQTIFTGLVFLRGSEERANAFERGICIVLIVLLVSAYRNRGRRVTPLVGIAAIAMLLTLPYTGINTASYYSGVAFFLALWRTLGWASQKNDRAPWRTALPIALVASTLCTLRQNYIPVPVVMLGVSYVFRFIVTRDRSRNALLEPVFVTLFSVVALVPWLVLSYQSNKTFLYPFMLGTFNRALVLEVSDPSVIREVKLQIGSFIDAQPLKTLGLFVLAGAFVREQDPRRPLASFAIGSLVGFLLLVHGLSQGDPGNVGRYAYGFFVAGALAVLVMATTRRPDAMRPVSSSASPTWRLVRQRGLVAPALALFATLVQIALSVSAPPPDTLFKTYRKMTDNIFLHVNRRPPPSERNSRETSQIYAAAQASIPQGARIAILLDQPFHLDFERNPIWNIDMPGYSSPAPGMPFFQGPEKVEAYLKGLGIRYLVFVDPTVSSYHYRRDYWVELLVDEMELWRNYAAYQLDFLDTLTAMSKRHRVLYSVRGIIAVDLQEAP